METVTNAINAASNAIWGENGTQHGDEPMSGVQGKGGAEDPYDAGNRDEQPGATQSDASTAPQEPRLDGKTDTVQTDSSKENGQPMSSNEAGGSGGGSSSEQQSSEQRSSDNKAADGENSEQVPHSALEDPNVNVSEEALKGPQGPAPHPAAEFEQENSGTGKPPLGTDENLVGKGDKDAGSKSHDNGGKHGTMSKMKERLNKVTHMHHSGK